MVDNQTFEEFYAQNKDLMYAALKKLRGTTAHDEETRQIALIKFWRAYEDYDPAKGEFSTLLYKYLHNELEKRDRYRKAKSRGGGVPEISLDISDPETPDEPYERGTINNISMYSAGLYSELDHVDFSGFLSSLTPRDREIVKMRMEGYKLREIGARLGVCGEYVRQRLDLMRPKFSRYI